MSGVIDTNILLYAANRSVPEHERARAFLREVQSDPGVWYLTEGIAYEFLRVATHPRVFPTPLSAADGLSFLETLLSWPGIAMLQPGAGHWALLRRVLASLHAPSGNILFDVRTAVLMREHGVRRIYTADTDFLQFDDLQVVNPVSPRPE